MKTKEILQKIFGVLSSLYLLCVAGIISYLYILCCTVDYISFESIIYTIVLMFAFSGICIVNAVLLFLKNVLNIKRISSELLICLLLTLLFIACFVFNGGFFQTYFANGFILAIIVFINMLLLKQPKNSKGVMLIGGSVAYLIAAIITAAPYVSTAIYALNPLIGDSLLKFDYSYIIIIVICILAALSFFGEGVYILINAISKCFNKNTYIIMFVWAALNVALKIIIPPQLTSTSLYLFYSFFGVIDTWLVYVNWNLLRYFIYILFVYHSLNFYKKEKTEEIKQLS